MKFKNLLNQLVTFKLTKVAFQEPSKNVSAWLVNEAIQENVKYAINETEKRGRDEKAKSEVFEMDIIKEIPPLNIIESDFKNCKFHENKDFWLTGEEIGMIIAFSKLINESKSPAN